MRAIIKSVLCAAVVALTSLSAWADDVFIIVSSNVALDAADVKDVFTGEKQLADTVKLTPVDNTSLQADFLAKVIKVDANKYATLWTKKGFRDGVNPPLVKASDAEVIAVVKGTPGKVGYVRKAPPDVKVIGKF